MPDRGPILDELVVRLAEGDRSAFSPLFSLLWPRLLRLCSSLLKNEADAADAAQQAMAKILERAFEYDPRRSALPWAMAIASWECRTILRKRVRRREVPEEWAQERSFDDAEALYVEKELVAAALGAMETLSDTDQETLLATFWEHNTTARGATLRKRRERALVRIRAALRKLYGLG